VIEPGTLIGNRYRVGRMVGGGGMKVVYQAEDLHLSDRLCALAEISDGFVDLKLRQQALDAFQREASLLAQLENPHIPRVHDYFNEGNRHYIVMEFVDGKTLERLLHESRGRFAEGYSVSIAVQLASTLDYLHARNPSIIYRDLKPANVIVTPVGLVKLIDFGIARHFQPATNATVIGTPGYAAPEQYRGRPQSGSDVYSLAALVHHMISGRDPNPEPPFSFPALKTLVPDCNGDLAELVMQGLEYDIQRRIKSAREFRDRLVAIKAGRDVLPQKADLQSHDSKIHSAPTVVVSSSETIDAAANPRRVPIASTEFCTKCGGQFRAGVLSCVYCGAPRYRDAATTQSSVPNRHDNSVVTKSGQAQQVLDPKRTGGTSGVDKIIPEAIRPPETELTTVISSAIRTLSGVNGQLELYRDKIVIKRKGLRAFLSQGIKGDKTIPLDSVTSVQLKPAGPLLNGYIQFSLPGAVEGRGGILDATRNENSVMFTSSSSSDAAAIKNYIEDWKAKRPTSHSNNSSDISVADELRKLKALCDEGVISKEEFERQKRRLIGG
jgi:serine/threonine protein kinase